MSKRRIHQDPTEARRKAYRELESSGESQSALWEVLALLKEGGIDLGDKANTVLEKRKIIKERMPK